MSNLSELREGLYWVRRITGEEDLGRSEWMVMLLVGAPPFLFGFVMMQRDENGDWIRRYREREDMYINPNEWEFGPRIDEPEDNYVDQ